MSILSRACPQPTGRVMYDTIQPVQIQMESKPTGTIRPYTTDRNEEYELRLIISQNFFANKVQRVDVERQAIEALSFELYKDVLQYLPRLRLAIQSGDKMGALQLTFDIERATKPDA